MSKRNEYLDVDYGENRDDSDQDDLEVEDSRTSGLARHVSKRRKISRSSSPASSHQGSRERNIEDTKTARSTSEQPESEKKEVDKNEVRTTPLHVSESTVHHRVHATRKKPPQPGVIYLSKIPPFMRPTTVRTLLSAHGPLTQLYLTPESPATYAARKGHGGNKKRSFIDGWVEFKHKRHAKACVDGINGRIVGGKKGGWYRDDVWNAKYLRGFRWDDLMAGVRQEEREREERVRVGIAKDRREREAFIKSLENAKVEDTRERKRKKKLENAANKGGSYARSPEEETGKERKANRGIVFRQNDIQDQPTKRQGSSHDVDRVLSKIF